MGKLFHVICLLLIHGGLVSQNIPVAVTNNSATNENVYLDPDVSSRILTSISPEVKMVVIDSVAGWYQIHIPIDGLESPESGWVRSGKEHFSIDTTNDFVELSGTRVVLRSHPGGQLKPFSVVWIHVDRDQNYAATSQGQFYAVRDKMYHNGEEWYRVYLTDSCKSMKEDKMVRTLFGWLPEQYINYHHSYDNNLDRTVLEELDEKYKSERNQNQEKDQKIRSMRFWNTLLIVGIVALGFLGTFYAWRIRKEKRKQWVARRFKNEMDDTYGLTDSNIEVWELLSHGLTEKQIAKKLFLSIDAVKSRRTSLYKKLEKGNPESGKFNKTKAGKLYSDEYEKFEKKYKKTKKP